MTASAQGVLGGEAHYLKSKKYLHSDRMTPSVHIVGLKLFQGKNNLRYNLCNCVDDQYARNGGAVSVLIVVAQVFQGKNSTTHLMTICFGYCFYGCVYGWAQHIRSVDGSNQVREGLVSSIDHER